MKIINRLLFAGLLAFTGGLGALAQVAVPSTFKHIAIDGAFGDWTGVPVAYTAPVGPTNAIQYENVYVANDQTNLYLRFTLYAPRPNAFANSYDNIFIDADNNPATGFAVGGIGSEMLIQWGGGYQERNGGFNEGAITNLGWNLAGSPDSTDFEIAISLGATYASDGTPVFANGTIAILLEGDNTSYINTAFAPPAGGLVYTFASASAPLTADAPLVTLANTSWEVSAAGVDLGTNWLDPAYDDTVAGWSTGDGLFGYTPAPGSYPAILTPLAAGANTYYFRTHVSWANDTDKVAFVVTNYLSDGAVYYLNGTEVRRVRMPSGTVAYSTAADATNSPVGHPDVFGIDPGAWLLGDNILEVEAHQAPASAADLVFGLSLTASIDYPVFVANPNLPADQSVLGGQSVTFTSDVVGSQDPTYQWFWNGTNAIAGANGPTYTIPLVLTNNAGTYSVQVSNSLPSVVTTRSAVLTVSNTPVDITGQPVGQVAVEGRAATFAITVSATPPIQYQWSFAGNPIPGATNATYSLPACDPTNAGLYLVTVVNQASTTNSAPVALTVLRDTIPPNLVAMSATVNAITITFSEPVDAVTAGDASKYAVGGGVTVVAATPNPGNPAQVTLTTGVAMNFGTVYTLTVQGVNDLFGNPARVSGQFARGITIDGSFSDWDGLTPVYSSTAPSGNTDAADFQAIYMYNDANYYYFRVTLWTDIDAGAGQFPYYVNMFYDTDNNAATGYSAIGSDLLVQSGYSYHEAAGSFNDGTGINGLNWLCLPASPGTNFEFQMSRAATYGSGNTPLFTTNSLNFVFQGMTPGFVVENTVPASGVISYTNVAPPIAGSLPLGLLSAAALPGGQAAVVWDPPGTLQESSALTGAGWTNLPAAVSPYVIPASGAGHFFRLTQ
jgi:hypothetical protein